MKKPTPKFLFQKHKQTNGIKTSTVKQVISSEKGLDSIHLVKKDEDIPCKKEFQKTTEKEWDPELGKEVLNRMGITIKKRNNLCDRLWRFFKLCRRYWIYSDRS